MTTIDPFDPQRIPVSAVPGQLDDPVSMATVYRWIFRGVGPRKEKLATVVQGRRRYTTPDALRDFFQRRTATDFELRQTKAAEELDRVPARA